MSVVFDAGNFNHGSEPVDLGGKASSD
jgi:hypothetical protein